MRGTDLRRLPLVERKERLRRSLEKAAKGSPVLYVQHSAGDGERIYQTLCGIGCEGMLAKRADRPYTSGRNRDWLKIKCRGYERAG